MYDLGCTIGGGFWRLEAYIMFQVIPCIKNSANGRILEAESWCIKMAKNRLNIKLRDIFSRLEIYLYFQGNGFHIIHCLTGWRLFNFMLKGIFSKLKCHFSRLEVHFSKLNVNFSKQRHFSKLKSIFLKVRAIFKTSKQSHFYN